MVTKRIGLVIDAPFNQRDHERFGIPLLQANGFEVTVYDVTPLVYGARAADVVVADPIDYQPLVTPASFGELAKALEREAFVIWNVHLRRDTLQLHRAVSRARIRYCLLATNPFPPLRRRVSARELAGRLYRALPLAWKGIRPADAVLAGGRASLRAAAARGRATRIVWAHALDYDIFLRERAAARTPAQRFAVFLDEYTPLHSDYAMGGMQPPMTADAYYPLMNGVLDHIEEQLAMPVVIAAHPRSRYDELPPYYGKRTPVRGRTVSLVRDAELVIGHCSTAFNYAALFRKPSVFVTTDDFQRHPIQGAATEAMARCFGKTPINVTHDRRPSLAGENTVDDGAYDRYIDEYIKTAGSPELPCWQIFADYVTAATTP